FEPRIFNGNIHYDIDSVSTTIDLDCSMLGENQIEITVTDDSGNVSTCIGTVNVLDETSPILICQDVTLELGPDGTLDVDPAALLANAPDTFEAMVIGSDNASGTAGETDFVVNVTANEIIDFDWDYTTDDGPGFDGFGYVINGTFTELTDPGLGNQSGSATVNLTAGDVFAFRSFTTDNGFGGNETLISNFQPGFSGQFDPANWSVVLNNSDGDAFFITIPGGPLSFDACGITVLAVDVTEVTCADIGTPITAMVFASDASGNLAACNSVITVVDALGPEVTCPADQTVDPGPGNLFYTVPDYWGNGDATASDNCTDPLTIFSQDPAPGTEIPDGVYTVTLCSTDEYGNETCCTFELTVESVLGVDDLALDNGVIMYPNPAIDIVNIANQSNILLDKATIFDMNGRIIQTVDLSDMGSEKAVNISNLASGTYMVQIQGETGHTVKQLVKQ
ncbi:T9SS type A sorting domain-containing protein, partial [bacterium]|nr:T9SS type A sorting domain-containing protein [bacterium]